jgi:hypothetical protein
MPHEAISKHTSYISPISNTNTETSQNVEAILEYEPIVMVLGIYIMPPKPVSAVYFINVPPSVIPTLKSLKYMRK